MKKLNNSRVICLSIGVLLLISVCNLSCKKQKSEDYNAINTRDKRVATWTAPDQYVFCVAADWDYIESDVKTQFGSSVNKSVAIGVCPMFYIFERSAATIEAELREHLRLAELHEVPILIQFDPYTFTDARPDLWNWWDSGMTGYNVNNKDNVEWTGWTNADAVKIGWLNWGSQTRLKPMMNLASTAYKSAVTTDMTTLIDIVKDWYDDLPTSQKWLFAGIKVTPEVWLGVNNWYYTNGNSYLSSSPSGDPTTGVVDTIRPSRGVQTIGYAGVKTAGIRTSGTITGDDISELARQFCLFTAQLCSSRGIARDHIFTHAGGGTVAKDLEACINDYACPSWSFYVANPSQYSQALAALSLSDAPYFGISEWASGSSTASDWTHSIEDGFCINKCRYLSVFTNVVGNSSTPANSVAIAGIKGIQATVVLTTEQTLSSGITVSSPNGNYTMTNQTDGNLVVYNGSTPVWSSGTSGQGASTLKMQNDGNLVLYKNGAGPTWSSGTYQGGSADYYLVLNNSGTLVLYAGSPGIGSKRILWRSN
ncbi:MAG: hypothetical protein EOP46_11150 [Sphingobacteriaceae bacterium]|nr:MAG: hypothetical protein EOP46_11150 [Sphingobacteriaceae bacterium]